MIELLKTCVEPATRGVSIKPGVERSGTPGSSKYIRKSPRSGRQPFYLNESQVLGYRTLRALVLFRFINEVRTNLFRAS